MKRVHSVSVTPRGRVSSARRWIARIALCFSLLGLGLPAQAASDGSAYVTAGTKAFDAGSDKDAWAFFLKAEKQGSTEALYWLGRMTELGLATKQDLRKAADFYKRGANAGWSMAQAKLGHFYLEGEGVIQDFAMARKWLEQAAYDNILGSQYDLGRIYEKGFGVLKNPVLAYVWYDFAARGGNPQYRKARDGALKALKPDKIVEAQKLAESMRTSVFGTAAGGN